MLPGMPTRAPALPPEERRVQLECAAVRVLHDRGLAATTKEMAAAAGVAEGTIFRVFDSKEALVHAALRRAFDLGPLVARVDAVEPALPLRERLVELVSALQDRFVDLFDLMTAVGMIRPPEDMHADAHEQQQRLTERMTALVSPDADQLTVSPEHLVRLVRLLTFSGSNRHIARGELLTPDEIVDALLDGTRKAAPPC
jgi:AcrR family transcriptional regulator